jgi:hypothetical protein
VSDEDPAVNKPDSTHGAHTEIHMPPPSFVPISVALALATTLVGFVDQVRNAVGGLVWGIGLLWLAASCVAWFLGARTEFGELPESLDGH